MIRYDTTLDDDETHESCLTLISDFSHVSLATIFFSSEIFGMSSFCKPGVENRVDSKTFNAAYAGHICVHKYKNAGVSYL